MKKMSLLIIVFLTITFLAADSDLTGKEVAANGKFMQTSGLSRIVDDELCVENETGLYQLHLGPEEYREMIGFQQTEGVFISVKGYFFNDHVAPQTIFINEAEYIFRDNYGKPMWSRNANNASNGQYKNENNWTNDFEDDCSSDLIDPNFNTDL